MTQQEILSDRVAPRQVLESRTVFTGKVWDVVRESISLGPGSQPFQRDYQAHTGAVAVLALNEQEEVLLIRQYRHPVRADLWEIPAGLLDIAGEDPLTAAARELAEETDLQAARWDSLMEFYNSPGGSSEACRIYLARGLSPLPAEQRTARQEEEAEIQIRWVPLEEAIQAVLTGRIHNSSATNGILALAAAKARNYASLYPADAPFTAHPGLRSDDFRGDLRPAEEEG